MVQGRGRRDGREGRRGGGSGVVERRMRGGGAGVV